MIILEESNTSQSFYCIPRYYEADSVTLTNETTQEVVSYNIDAVTSDHYLIITGTFDLRDGITYLLKVNSGGTEVYRDKVFVTDQVSYSINNDYFVSHNTTNEFIIIS
jgi:hypothetical protein